MKLQTKLIEMDEAVEADEGPTMITNRACATDEEIRDERDFCFFRKPHNSFQ